MRPDRRKKRGSPAAAVLLVLLFAGLGLVLFLRLSAAAPAPEAAPPEATETPAVPTPSEPEAAPIFYTVRYHLNGETSAEEVEAGETLVFPSVEVEPGYTFFGWDDGSGALFGGSPVTPEADADFTAVFRLSLGTESHAPYLSVDATWQSRPDEILTRADAAIMLYGLLSKEAEPGEGFTDLTEDDACFEAASALKALGVLDGEEFRPADPLTRGELLQMLRAFYPDALLASDDPGAAPEEEMSRLATAKLMNPLLGRSADPSVLDRDLAVIFGLPEDEEDRLAILEAILPHTPEASGEGELWTEVEIPEPPIPGFSTGDLEVDAWLKQIIDEKTNENMTLKEKLRALYLYVLNTFRYRKGEVYAEADPGILVAETRKMMVEQGGNCWTHASLLCELYRAIGVDAKVYGGTIGDMQAHAWVEADVDGNTYVFDAEMEKTILRFHKDYFDFFMRTYNDVRGWAYQRDFVIE